MKTRHERATLAGMVGLLVAYVLWISDEVMVHGIGSTGLSVAGGLFLSVALIIWIERGKKDE